MSTLRYVKLPGQIICCLWSSVMLILCGYTIRMLLGTNPLAEHNLSISVVSPVDTQICEIAMQVFFIKITLAVCGALEIRSPFFFF